MAKLQEEQRARQRAEAERQRAEAARRRQEQAAAGKWGVWGGVLEVEIACQRGVEGGGSWRGAVVGMAYVGPVALVPGTS